MLDTGLPPTFPKGLAKFRPLLRLFKHAIRICGLRRLNEMLRVSPWIMGFACGIGSTVAGGFLVLFFSWVFRNSLATRPTMAGALYGAGAGLAINAGWRIACPISTPWHALGAHGAAIIVTVILGALIGRFLGNRRLHIGGRRS